MPIALYGGPLDGTIDEGLSHMPPFMVAATHLDRPIYKRVSCLKCKGSHERAHVPYVFMGYDSSIRDAEQALRAQWNQKARTPDSQIA